MASLHMPVRLVFADFNQNYSLMGIIVRKVVIGENKIVYGYGLRACVMLT